MSAVSDDELDDILDSALDNFDVDDESRASNGGGGAKASVTKEQGVSDDTKAKSAASDASATPPTADAAAVDEALRAFEEALKIGSDGDTTADADADLALVEEFVRSLGADGESGENFIKRVLDDVLSKDVLYEPVSQIRDALARGLDDSTLDERERARRRHQHSLASDLCAEFDADARPERVVELLAELKNSGSLPSDVVAALPDDDGDDAGDLGAAANGCPVQ